MEQRDLLKDEIEQLGKVLANILADFLGLANRSKTAIQVEYTNEKLQEELDIDILKMLAFTKEELKKYIEGVRLSEVHIEILSNYFEELGKVRYLSDKYEASQYFQKAMELLDLADDISQTASLSRISKKEKIKGLLTKT